MSAANLKYDDDLWEEPEDQLEELNDGNYYVVHQGFDKPFDQDDKELFAKLNFGRYDLWVRPSVVKTYGCLHLVLDDLQVLLKIWRQRTLHPLCVRFTASGMEPGSFIHNQISPSERSPFVTLFTLLQSVHMHGIVFKSYEDFEELMSSINSMRGSILRLIVPCLNNLFQDMPNLPLEAWEIMWPLVLRGNWNSDRKLQLRLNLRSGQEAALEGDLITDTFGAAADFAQAIWESLFKWRHLDNYDGQEFRYLIRDLNRKYAILMDLVSEERPWEGSAEDQKLSSLLERGHYTVKQLQFKSGVFDKEHGHRAACDQALEELLILESCEDSCRTEVNLWSAVKRKVSATIIMCNPPGNIPELESLKFFLFGKELVGVSTTIAKLGHFFFTVVRWEIDPDMEKRLDMSDWSQPSMVREVVTDGPCRELTFHMFKSKEEQGDLVWLAVFQDKTCATKVVFFDPSSGAETKRHDLTGRLELKAIKDDRATFIDKYVLSDKYENCSVYKINAGSMDLVAKISLQNLTPAAIKIGAEPYNHGITCSLGCFFEETSNARFVIVTQQGELQMYGGSDLDKPLMVLPPLPRIFEADTWCAEVAAHCLTDEGLLFALLNDYSGTYHVKAVDMLSSDPAGATYRVCAFKSPPGKSNHGSSYMYQYYSSPPKKTKQKRTKEVNNCPPQHFIPYTRRYSGCVGSHGQKCLSYVSYMWVLEDKGKFQLRYSKEAETLFVVNDKDKNFVEIKFLRQNATSVRAELAAKKREVQAKWLNVR